jgi:hypothetical protein
MVRRYVTALGVAGGLVLVVGAWNLYQRSTTPEVPYTTVAHVGDAELRRYPATVLVETVAPSENEAFGRLFRYIAGSNSEDDEIPMTAPVEVTGRGRSLPPNTPVRVQSGREIPMTAPVEFESGTEEGVRMAFYLPAGYDVKSTPRPTDEDVSLVAAPERTLAVLQFSGRPTDDRVASETDRLLTGLDAAAVAVAGEPFFLGYDAPWTLPFLRRNEVAVEVETGR